MNTIGIPGHISLPQQISGGVPPDPYAGWRFDSDAAPTFDATITYTMDQG